MIQLYYYREFDHLMYLVQYAKRQRYLASNWHERQWWNNAHWFLHKQIVFIINCERCN